MIVELEKVKIESIKKMNKDYAVMCLDNDSIKKLENILLEKYNENISASDIYIDIKFYSEELIKNLVYNSLYLYHNEYFVLKFSVNNRNEVYLEL